MVDKIKQIAKSKRYTFAQLERECGFGNGTISKWDTHKPSTDKVEKLASYLGVPVAELMSDEPYKEHSNISAAFIPAKKEDNDTVKQMLFYFINNLDAKGQTDLLIELLQKQKEAD